ncbi:helix-turn-helix domain-containing protein [Streptomyces sp. NPDC057963]|uniref:AraC-like ligand-binding domain-containing protein n=1 Tax=Streptomyces sp. NPDC057963 TaxID=3346290 RepID=UPI0036EFAD46
MTTDDLPNADRFTWWHEMTRATLIPTLLASDHTVDFRAAANVVDLGAAQVTAMTYLPLTSARTSKLIRQSDPEYCQLSLTVRGDMGLSQCGREATFGSGELMLYDSSFPFEGWTAAEDGSVAHIVAQIPKTLLPFPARLLNRLSASRIPADEGFSELLATFLTQVTSNAHRYRTSDGVRLAMVLIDLLGGTVAHCLETDNALPPESRHRVLFLQVQRFIRQHIGDPDLSAETIALAHHISVRSLHRIFQQEGTTVRALIRSLRLDGCRHDLANPLHRHRTIQGIAARWGFPRPADFTRAFRTAYGMPPSEYRHQVLRQA